MRILILLSITVTAALVHRVAAQTSVEVLEVSMRRTACLGRCPIYDLTLTRVGPATYNGVMLAARTGSYRASVDSAAFARLAQLLVRGGFFSLDTAYDVPVTDMATTFLCIRTAAVTRCIRHYGHAGPRALSSLEDSDDAFVTGLTWVRNEVR